MAASLNDRPRKTLDYATPNETFTKLIAEMAGERHISSGSVRYGT
jgi:hypothetical protein